MLGEEDGISNQLGNLSFSLAHNLLLDSINY